MRREAGREMSVEVHLLKVAKFVRLQPQPSCEAEMVGGGQDDPRRARGLKQAEREDTCKRSARCAKWYRTLD